VKLNIENTNKQMTSAVKELANHNEQLAELVKERDSALTAMKNVKVSGERTREERKERRIIDPHTITDGKSAIRKPTKSTKCGIK
jgi:hypothetical protein